MMGQWRIREKNSFSTNHDARQHTEIAGGTFAVLRFKGWSKEESRSKASEALAALITGNNLKPEGATFFAFYDPPWTPELMRRNEIWQRITP